MPGSQELPPRRRRPPRRGPQPRGGQDPADRPLPRRAPQAEHLALDAPVAPARVLPRQLLHQRPHLVRDGRSSWCIRVGPFLLDHAPVPGQQGPWRHDVVQAQVLGSSLARAAITAWSAQSGSGRVTCRRKSAISCRSTKISTSLAASFRARSTSQPKTRTANKVDEADEHER